MPPRPGEGSVDLAGPSSNDLPAGAGTRQPRARRGDRAGDRPRRLGRSIRSPWSMHLGVTLGLFRTAGLLRGNCAAEPPHVPTRSRTPLADCLRARRPRLRNDSRVRGQIGGGSPGLDDGPDARPAADHESAADATSSGLPGAQTTAGYTASRATSRPVASAAAPAAGAVKPGSRSVRSRPPAEARAPLGTPSSQAPCQAPRSVVSTLPGSFTTPPELSRAWSCCFDARPLVALERSDGGDRRDRVRRPADRSRSCVRARVGCTRLRAGPPP